MTAEDAAIEYCRQMNRGLDSKDPGCCAVIDGPDNNWAVVDLKTASEILDPEGSGLTCLVVTDGDMAGEEAARKGRMR